MGAWFQTSQMCHTAGSHTTRSRTNLPPCPFYNSREPLPASLRRTPTLEVGIQQSQICSRPASPGAFNTHHTIFPKHPASSTCPGNNLPHSFRLLIKPIRNPHALTVVAMDSITLRKTASVARLASPTSNNHGFHLGNACQNYPESKMLLVGVAHLLHLTYLYAFSFVPLRFPQGSAPHNNPQPALFGQSTFQPANEIDPHPTRIPHFSINLDGRYATRRLNSSGVLQSCW